MKEDKNKQNNNIPEKIQTSYKKNQKDNDLGKLYIENYSNTEFIMEPDVYNYLKQFSDLLKYYNKSEIWQSIERKSQRDEADLMQIWYGHLREIMNELFNDFIHGNFLSATAMIRTLIECFVYIKILIKEENQGLVDEWFLCNSILKIKENNELSKKLINQIKYYCAARGLDFEDAYHKFYKKNENSWLAGVINKKRIIFHDACKYLGKSEIYDDFQYLCAFVHGQDVYTKMIPFTFYSSIYSKMYLMSEYIFESIRMFEIDELLEENILDLEKELFELGEKYML